MNPEVDELKPKLKEILYDCAVDIRATKAALFLLDSSARKFELVTEYGFRSGIRQAAGFNDPLIDRCQRGRTPFFVNSAGADPKLSDLLFEGSTQRLLAAPLYSRGQLVGVIDMRDKAAQQPFEQSDLPKAQAIGDRILQVFATKNLFNQRFITLSDVDEIAPPRASTAPVPVVAPPVPLPLSAPPIADIPDIPRAANDNRLPPGFPATAVAPAPAAVSRAVDPAAVTARISAIVSKARTAAARIVAPSAPQMLGDAELVVIRDVLRSVMFLPGAVVAAVSATGESGAVQEVVAKAAMDTATIDALQSKLQLWLTKRGESTGPLRTNITTPFGPGNGLSPRDLVKVFTAPVVASSLRGVYLTIAFSEPPERTTHEMLTSILSHLQIAIETSINRNLVATMRQRAAEELVEPRFTSYPDLRRHSATISAKCEQFARFLGIAGEELENTRLAGLVHDAGMRFLDYERLYRKRDLTADELSILREHVTVGAAIVEPLLGTDIARIVLTHHERVDGRGYPNELQGNEIPLPARIIAIVDAYHTMVDSDSYQPPESHEEAMAALNRGAGAQFDAELVARFAEFMSASR